MTEIKEKCLKIEEELRISFDYTQATEIIVALDRRTTLSAEFGTLIEEVTILYSEEKGEVAKDIIETPRLLNLKQGILNKYIEGRLAKASALYERVDRDIKTLEKSIETLRSLLSYERELVRNKVTQT